MHDCSGALGKSEGVSWASRYHKLDIQHIRYHLTIPWFKNNELFRVHKPLSSHTDFVKLIKNLKTYTFNIYHLVASLRPILRVVLT